MEEYNYNENQNKIGAGIIVISILVILGSIISLFSSIRSAMNPNLELQIQKTYQQLNMEFHARPTSYFVISIILNIVTIVSIILILNKNSLGIYGYFTSFIISLIAAFVFRSFSIKTTLMSIPFSFILPIIMLIFICKKKQLFGFSSSEN